MTLDELVDRLRVERLTLRAKQGDVAAAIGVRQGALCNWEQHRNPPSREHMQAWASFLGVEVPAELLTDLGARKPCGTVAAYRRHLNRAETPCGPCKRANADAAAAFKKSRSK